MNEKFCILIQISLNFYPKGPIDKKSALAQVVDWRRTGDKPLLEAMLIEFTDAYIRADKFKLIHINPHETARYGEIASAILNFFVCCMEMG